MNLLENKQQGFTLIELLIGIVVGLIAIAAVLSVTTSMIRGNTDYLRMVRLNQELHTVMTLITRDLKRAGYWRDATGLTQNIFMTATTDVIVENDVSGTIGDCVLFSYDIDVDGNYNCPFGPSYDTADGCNADGTDERLGFRYDRMNDQVDVRQSGLACNTGVNTWTPLTDENVVNITTLRFTTDYFSSANSGNEEILYITITLAGELISDPDVQRTLTEQVRVRNDNVPVF